MIQFPVFINCRDQVSYLIRLVNWLEEIGQERIYLIDNDSTYPALLDYYSTTPHNVIFLKENIGHKAPWKSGVIKSITNSKEYFVVTDPDVLPIQECPQDVLSYFHETLKRYPKRIKCGFSLKLDDLPDHYEHKQLVMEKELKFWNKTVEPGIYDAQLDTTFALYRPGQKYGRHPSLRTEAPYCARHLPWYQNSAELTEEEIYYRDHLSEKISHWNSEKITGFTKNKNRAPWKWFRK